MNYYDRAKELAEQTVAHRRYMHTNAEAGLDLPKTKAYVMEQLRSFGIEPKDCGYGVTATLGKGGKVLLLRADMDALPMGEESGEEFACPTGKTAHTCGHDFHAAMLLTAAKMLKENEDACSLISNAISKASIKTFYFSTGYTLNSNLTQNVYLIRLN